MHSVFQFSLCILVFTLAVCSANREKRSLRKIAWEKYPFGKCTSEHYMCLNMKCIERGRLCDGNNDCGDKSDEEYCNMHSVYNCPRIYKFYNCARKCIPEFWKCDEIIDCPDGSDERNCADIVKASGGVQRADQKAQLWLQNQVNRNTTTDKWGKNVPRTAVALYFASKEYFTLNSTSGNEMTYEITIWLLQNLMKEDMGVTVLTSNELAVYLNGLIVSCKNPSDFYGVNIVRRLRQEVDQQTGHINPFILLALCNAGDSMTQKDVEKLFSVFDTPLQSTWTETRAFALMALSCIAASENGPPVARSNLTRLASELKKKQNANGSFESVPTTALVIQALIASVEDEIEGWDFIKAVKYLVKSQQPDGSFGSLLNTYYVFPVLKQKSLADVNSKHCPLYSFKNQDEVQDHLESDGLQHVPVKYSLGFRDMASVIFSLTLRVPINSTVFDLMKMASALDSKYKFKYITKNSKPYVYEMGGVQDDAEYGKFWFLCKLNATTNVARPINASPVDVIIKEEGEFIMWYRSPHGFLDQLSIT